VKKKVNNENRCNNVKLSNPKICRKPSPKSSSPTANLTLTGHGSYLAAVATEEPLTACPGRAVKHKIKNKLNKSANSTS